MIFVQVILLISSMTTGGQELNNKTNTTTSPILRGRDPLETPVIILTTLCLSCHAMGLKAFIYLNQRHDVNHRYIINIRGKFFGLRPLSTT